MTMLIMPVKQIKKMQSKNAEEILARLQRYLDGNLEEPMQILCGFWKDQQNVITYQELREVVKKGLLDESIYQSWSRDYSKMIANKWKPILENAMQAGSISQPLIGELPFTFRLQTPHILNWIEKRGAAFVTSSSIEQRQAIQALLAQKVLEKHTVDELARFLRPCIGLTEVQAKANLRYYDNIVTTLKKEHPRMKLENIQKKARDAAAKYAERQHRQRAMTIAQTETAFAYNRGADEAIRQAQSQNLIGIVKKRWCTSGDDHVCSICQALEGMEIEMDKEFPFKGRKLFQGQDLLPPAHPRCACAVEYIEVESHVFADTLSPSITQKDSFREYSTEEIESIAEQTEGIISKHISVPSMWSGNMVIDDNGIKYSDEHVTYYGKMWNCDILTKHETAPAIIIHEQIHARSISYYKPEIYSEYGSIEEASVQLMAEEICKKENIEIISSDYEKLTGALRQIRSHIGIYSTDYEFAKKLIEMPVIERLDWLSEESYAILRNNATTTLEEYQRISELLDILY